MPIVPLYDQVVVRSVQAQTTTSFGLVIPTASQDRQQAEVVAVGAGVALPDGTIRPLTLKAGDKVVLGEYSGTPVTVDGEQLFAFREKEIIGVVV